MSKQRIRWIVALMAVGLLGLVGFQVYWIRNALHLQQEQFAYKVTDALQEVVRTLERQEIVYMTQQRLHAQQQQYRLRQIGRKTRPEVNPAWRWRTPGSPDVAPPAPTTQTQSLTRPPVARRWGWAVGGS